MVANTADKGEPCTPGGSLQAKSTGNLLIRWDIAISSLEISGMSVIGSFTPEVENLLNVFVGWFEILCPPFSMGFNGAGDSTWLIKTWGLSYP